MNLEHYIRDIKALAEQYSGEEGWGNPYINTIMEGVVGTDVNRMLTAAVTSSVIANTGCDNYDDVVSVSNDFIKIKIDLATFIVSITALSGVSVDTTKVEEALASDSVVARGVVGLAALQDTGDDDTKGIDLVTYIKAYSTLATDIIIVGRGILDSVAESVVEDTPEEVEELPVGGDITSEEVDDDGA